MISIVIPTYNRQDLLKKSIEAILNNSLLPSEILIIEQ
jgi:glycosyltransferase involved in cell wall biosynthesis